MPRLLKSQLVSNSLKGSTAPESTSQKEQDSSYRGCTECKKKPPQVQCLHCSQYVCLECAQKHANSVAAESEDAVHLLNEKIDVLDRISTITRQKIAAERDKILRKADAERDRSFTLLAEMIEQEKQQLRNKNEQLKKLPLNEVPTFIRNLKSDLQYLTDKNDTLFNVNSKGPQITLQRQNERLHMKNRSKFEEWSINEESLSD